MAKRSLYVNAGNDRNGNPRRGWVISTGGRQVAFVNEGYGGSESLRRACPGVGGGDFRAMKISASEFRRLRKELPRTCPGGSLYGARRRRRR